jgi:hypothetical protein
MPVLNLVELLRTAVRNSVEQTQRAGQGNHLAGAKIIAGPWLRIVL